MVRIYFRRKMDYFTNTYLYLSQKLFNYHILALIITILILSDYVFFHNYFWIALQHRLSHFYGYFVTNKDSAFGIFKGISSDSSKVSWDLQKDSVAVYAIQGRRPNMEDRFNIALDIDAASTSVYGIFDGHGGEFAADYVEKTLFKNLMTRLLPSPPAETKASSLQEIITEEILNTDKHLLQIEGNTNEVSGTTALVAIIQGSTLVVANVGDSRGVMCDQTGKTIPLSYDHKPQQLRERKRIKRSGGFISFNGVWRVAGVLATSRALGDLPLKDRDLVIAEPDVLTFDLEEIQPKFLILATDGLWDAFSNEEAVQFISERLQEPYYGAKSLVLQAYYRGSLDNITILVINIQAQKTAKVTQTRKG